MATDYNAIDFGNGSEGYGNGAYGLGEGWQGSLYGGDPMQMYPGGPGGQGGPISLGGGGGERMSPPIIEMPTNPGAGGGGGGGGGRGPGSGYGAQDFKPMLSQMLGLSPQGPSQRMHPGGAGRQGPPRVAPQPRPITGFGPRPNPDPRMHPGGPGGPPQPQPGPRMNPGGPMPIAAGGGLAGGQGRRPIATGGPRRMQPGL